MSQWTHIRGGLELVSTPYETKPIPKSLIKPKKEDFETDEAFEDAYYEYRQKLQKLLYFPYPEKQFRLLMPRPGESYSTNKKTGERIKFNTIEFEAMVYSLPRARKYIEEAFKLMPYGEGGLRYSLDQNDTDCSTSSSCLNVPCEYKAYKDTLNRLYKSDNLWDSYSYKDLRKWFHINDDCSVSYVNHILVGIRDDIRYASAYAVQEGLEKIFKYLEEHDIDIEDGYLEWQDEYEPEYIYAWRSSRLSYGIAYQFLKLDAVTNKVVYSKTKATKKDEKGYSIYDDNTKDYIWEIIEKDGPYLEKNPWGLNNAK